MEQSTNAATENQADGRDLDRSGGRARGRRRDGPPAGRGLAICQHSPRLPRGARTARDVASRPGARGRRDSRLPRGALRAGPLAGDRLARRRGAPAPGSRDRYTVAGRPRHRAGPGRIPAPGLGPRPWTGCGDTLGVCRRGRRGECQRRGRSLGTAGRSALGRYV